MSSAVGKVHGGEPSRAQWLAAQCIARPELISQVEAVIRDPYCRRDVSPLCTWEDWHRGMRLLESALRRGTETFTPNDFRDASSLLRHDGHPFAGVLSMMGAYAERVESYRRSWPQRYASRVPTADEAAAAQLVADGQVWQRDRASWAGVDGARYALVVQGGRPAVLVENSADAIELVLFSGERAARAWMHNRVRGSTGRLGTGKAGPACRASLEEDVLAWLVRAAHDAQPWGLLRQVAWTSHLRAELYRAAEACGKGTPATDPGYPPTKWVRWNFLHWLAFAPGWAADEIGWPDARHARAYWERLAMTPADEAQALRAAQVLVRADVEAGQRAGIATPEVAVAAGVTGASVHRPAPSGWRPIRSATSRSQRMAGQGGVQPPPQRPPGQAGPEPR